MIDAIAKLKDAKFIRNGNSYDVSTAVRFLRLKWAAKQREIKTAHDFIDNVASFSSTSGQPYIIRFGDGSEVRSRDYLADRLQKIESSLFHTKTSGG